MFCFNEIDTTHLQNKTIFVDIDGTLVYEGELYPDATIMESLRKLGQDNNVYLCSNARNHERGIRIAEGANVRYIKTLHRKPSTKILDSVSEKDLPYVVIGDKILTDGLFAMRVGAEFIKVLRLTPPHKNSLQLSTQLVHSIDDIATHVISIIRMIRPVQQLKNALILAPIFFAQKIFDIEALTGALVATFVFCLLAGSIYSINDIADVENDRKHPRKRFRPVASGLLGVSVAISATIVLIIVAFTTAWLFVPQIIPLLIAYVVLNLLYSYWLKHIHIIDIITVSLFYVIRILVGGLAVSVSISSWLIFTTIFLSLFLVIGKRLSEMRGPKVRKVMDFYTDEFLSKLLTIVATATLISYGIYTVLHFENQNVVYSIFPVLFGVFRYLHILSIGTAGETPEKILVKDRMIQLSILCWLIIIAFVFY